MAKSMIECVEHIPYQPPDYDPWEENICGSHKGEALVITCDDTKLKIQEFRSGIGPEFEISLDGKRIVSFWRSDDDGSLEMEVRRGNKKTK